MTTFKDRNLLEKYIELMVWCKKLKTVTVTLGKPLDEELQGDIRHLYKIELVDSKKFIYLFTKKV